MSEGKGFTEAIYRLRLMEAIYREMQIRAARTEDGRWEPGAIEDLVRLKSELPMPEDEAQVDGFGPEIRRSLASSRSELVRDIPFGNLAHHMRMAFRQSQQPYRPTLDEMMPLV